MLQLLLGIALFFGIHSASIVTLPLRDKMVAKSENGWKAIYAVVSLIGIVLMVRGYADLRQTPTLLYVPPVWLRHVAALLMLPVFAFFIAPYFPGRIKSALKHPQLIAVKIWAVAHLLVNGTLADVLLFGSFLLWAVADRISLKNRVARPLAGAPESKSNDVILIVVGLALYAAFVFWLHEVLFGIRPFA
ncbi:MAG: NnrU family protein [Gammaproteobacteria bacterium]|jgi:uncharacterized membrane protein|nr:NnrU family protein [Gammaproteobacteria bacterium]MDH3751546.1 NnrU family protein [Gammaproteobacteria bacterium]MDH3804994.1 NnrU family protein [Gammaproteobacteria bacterium]